MIVMAVLEVTREVVELLGEHDGDGEEDAVDGIEEHDFRRRCGE